MITRRDVLKLGAGGIAAAAVDWNAPAAAQTPKRGGTLTIRAWDPPHFDHVLTHSYKIHIPVSFTHSQLLKYRAGAAVKPGSFQLKGDLAESWTQTSDTTYVVKLKRGVRFHGKPPVNGRELTADDVRFTVERFLTANPSPNAPMLSSLDRVEAVDRYTVKFTLKEPLAWFLDMLANPMALAITAHECVEKFGDLKRPEACVGTGPFMLDTYKPNTSLTLVRNPNYFVAGLPYIDRVELYVDEDNSSRLATSLAGKYDLGTEASGTISRTDWVQLKDTLKQKRPRLQSIEMPSNVMSDIAMRTDRPPFDDVRVRQAISLAVNRQGLLDATEGKGLFNAPVPAALSDWSLPINQLGEGAKYYRHDPAEARRLLAAAGYPKGFPASVCFATYGSSNLVDNMQLVLKYLKDVGIDARLDQKEYAAYVATCRLGKYDSMMYGPLAPFLEPDNFLYSQYHSGEPRNRSFVRDPVLDDMLIRQRRTFDVAKRRDIFHDIQRYLAKQQYYVPMASAMYVAVWDSALKNYAPNLGFDYGGRVTAAWMDR